MNPRPESRISSLENRSATIEATLLELSNDTAEELKVLRQKQQDLFTHVQNGFDQAHSYIKQEIETRLDQMQGDINELKSTQVEQGKKLDQIMQFLQQKLGE